MKIEQLLAALIFPGEAIISIDGVVGKLMSVERYGNSGREFVVALSSNGNIYRFNVNF